MDSFHQRHHRLLPAMMACKLSLVAPFCFSFVAGRFSTTSYTVTHLPLESNRLVLPGNHLNYALVLPYCASIIPITAILYYGGSDEYSRYAWIAPSLLYAVHAEVSISAGHGRVLPAF